MVMEVTRLRPTRQTAMWAAAQQATVVVGQPSPLRMAGQGVARRHQRVVAAVGEGAVPEAAQEEPSLMKVATMTPNCCDRAE